GARPLRRAIQTLIEDPLSEQMLMGTWKAGDVIAVDAGEDGLTFSKGEGEIPAMTERVHMDLPRAREHWSAPAGGHATPGASGGLASAE
ncbi:MAG: NDP-hexose 4-ketoreductase, partial [Parafannyhessea umbonata]|nr:NDP-hexose 4-ketoreductase [Parafannyhessea umbonata]